MEATSDLPTSREDTHMAPLIADEQVSTSGTPKALRIPLMDKETSRQIDRHS